MSGAFPSQKTHFSGFLWRMGVAVIRIAASCALSLALACAAASAEPSTGAPASGGGVCLGTSEECAAGIKDKPRPGFDMVITFALDSAELTAEAQATLAQFATALRENRLRTYNFVLEGHTDALGSASYNTELSRRRADAVSSFLRENGVSPERISTVGRGLEDPRTDDPFDPANRRVEVRIRP